MRLKDDLISRSDVAEFMFENRMCTSINNAYDKLRCIKTAYDVEKVVEQLEEWTFNADVNLGDGIKNSDLIASKNAIDIVKRGGVNDD